MRRKNLRFGGWVTLGVLVLGCGTASAAGNPQFGMVGLAAGQVLRLNVVAYPPSPCVAAIGFRNAAGQVPQPTPDKTVSLNPGESAFVDLPAAALGIQLGARREFQPVVTLYPQPTPDTSAAPNACAASVEVFDSFTGLSLVAYPQPEPDLPNVAPQFGMAGIALGQVLRLNVVAFPPDPCSATIGFLDSNGVPMPEPDKSVYLNPGEAAFIDLPAGALGIQFGQRAELQPVVTLQPAPNGSSACQATVEVYDRFSGRTWTMLYPQPQPD